jgi:hypothetical protein
MNQEWDVYRSMGEQAETAGNYAYAEAMWAMASLICQQFGDLDPRVVLSLDSLGRCLVRQHKFRVAEYILGRSWHIKTQVSGATPPELNATLELVGEMYFREGKLQEAYPICKRVYEVYVSTHGPEHPKSKEFQNNLAMLEPIMAQAAMQAMVQQSQAAAQNNPAPAVSAPAPGAVVPRMKAGAKPRCELCGAVLDAEWCIRCTGSSMRPISPGNRLT